MPTSPHVTPDPDLIMCHIISDKHGLQLPQSMQSASAVRVFSFWCVCTCTGEIVQLAAVANDKEMPRFPIHKHGLLIPEDKDSLIAQNYQLG